ncbi:cardiolipin synthase like protein [Babesia gibsoni]|uniref:Cardiolipin synthase like protein n=1 Tax=Babesia gibsoni TaxID=33632 RepID=A0AAD8PDR5_BABGI|nr:cardiolipin synthase like protein [Babesia gibsoni]
MVKHWPKNFSSKFVKDPTDANAPSLGSNDIHDEIQKIIARSGVESLSEPIFPTSKEITKWANILSLMSTRFGRLSRGNQIHICQNGTEALSQMLDAIDRAKERVWLEVYIFDDSPLAARFTKSLQNAARRGCEVVLVIDYIGSLSFPDLYQNELEKHGVKLHIFNPFTGRRFAVGSMPFRDHKKILIVDDHTAFCGSVNISKDGGTEEVGGNGRFYDLAIKLKGPAVYDLAQVLKGTLKMTPANLHTLKPLKRPDPIEDGVLVQILESNMSRRTRRNGIQSSLEAALSQAEREIYLTSSYFYPPGFLKRSLINAKRKGLSLHMLLSGNSDIPGDVNATIHVLRKFYKSRFEGPPNSDFKVFMTTKEHCHSKAVVIDGLWSSVGSFNWDRWSSRRNLEVSVGVFDPVTANKLKQLQTCKERESMEYTAADVASRPRFLQLFDSFIYKLVRLSGRNFFDGLSDDGFKFRFKKAFIRTLIDDHAGEMIAMSSMACV